MFDALTVSEWDQLCSKLESALYWLNFSGLAADEIADLHGDLMLTWQARIVASEWGGYVDMARIPTGTGWPA
jgi:hypothetical protein